MPKKRSAEVQKLKRSNVSLEKKLEALEKRLRESRLQRVMPVPDVDNLTEEEKLRNDAVHRISDEFEQDTLTKMKHIVNNFDGTYREVLEQLLTNMLQVGVENETKKNGYEFSPSDVKPIVSLLGEQLRNEVMTLCGKSKQCTFQPLTWEISHALWSHKESAYVHHTKLNPLHYPSVSSMKKVRTHNRVRDGSDPTIFLKRKAVLDHRGTEKEHAIALADEMQLKGRVKWCTNTGRRTGLVLHHSDKMRFGMYSDKIDEEYKHKYFPQLLQHCNNAGVCH